jgi:hypothetical protein
MAEKRTKHQEKIIRNYYQHKDELALQRLGELATDLYLAEGKKRAQAWKWIVAAMEKLGVPASRIEHLVAKDNPALVAQLVNELLGKK